MNLSKALGCTVLLCAAVAFGPMLLAIGLTLAAVAAVCAAVAGVVWLVYRWAVNRG